jgi:hypothetical protein
VKLRSASLGALLAATAAALALPLRGARAEGDGRTIAVVLDRSASLNYADATGTGRAALAFALAFAARPVDRLLVAAPALDPPVGGDATDLEALAGALRTILKPPRQAGGVELDPVFAQAIERAGEQGILVAYSDDELDVIDQDGKAPDAALAAARQKNPRPDRAAVNEAARAALVESLAGAKLSGRLFALKALLPREARAVPFLEALGARTVELDVTAPLEAARALAALLGRDDLATPRTIAKGETAARIEVTRGTRVAVAAAEGISVRADHALALDPEKRFWLVDADGPFELEGATGKGVAWLAGTRVPLGLDVHGWKLPSGSVVVSARHADPTLPLELRAAIGGGEGAVLGLRAKGLYEGRLEGNQVPKDAATIRVEPTLGGLTLPAVEAPLEHPLVRIEASPESALVAGAPVELFARPVKPLPESLLGTKIAVELAAGDARARAELARSGDGFSGRLAFPTPGKFTLASAAAGDLELELAGGAFEIAPPPTLTAHLAGTGGPLLLENGKATAQLLVSIAPPPQAPAPLGVALEGVAGLSAELSAGATAEGSPAPVLVIVSGTLEKAADGTLALEARLPKGVVARARVPVELNPPLAWKKFVALGLGIVAVLWAAIAIQRRRALERLLGKRQLRGLGPSGKITPERYLLREYLVSRRAALISAGRTSVRIELEKDGRVTALAPEGVELLKLEKGSRRCAEVALVHGTAFAALRDPSIRRFVFLDGEPTAEELQQRFVPDARSFTEEEQEAQSDLFVLLEEDENLSAESGRLLGGKSARIGASARLGKGESARLGDSERLAVDPAQLQGDSARLVPGDSARIPEAVPKGSASDEPIVIADSAEGKILADGEVVILDPGSSDEVGTDEEIDPVSSEDMAEEQES